MKTRIVITEADILAAARSGKQVVDAPAGSIVSPLARDTARAKGISLNEVPHKKSRPDIQPAKELGKGASGRGIALGSDHGGFAHKGEVSAYLASLGWEVIDVGTDSEARCDYPDFAYAVARMVAVGTVHMGIMIDGAGPGSAIVCNKVPGVRAAAAGSEFVAWNARAHNDCNVLVLGSRVTGVGVALRIVKTFVETAFEGGRHASRVGKILDVEQRFSRS